MIDRDYHYYYHMPLVYIHDKVLYEQIIIELCHIATASAPAYSFLGFFLSEVLIMLFPSHCAAFPLNNRRNSGKR